MVFLALRQGVADIGDRPQLFCAECLGFEAHSFRFQGPRGSWCLAGGGKRSNDTLTQDSASPPRCPKPLILDAGLHLKMLAIDPWNRDNQCPIDLKTSKNH